MLYKICMFNIFVASYELIYITSNCFGLWELIWMKFMQSLQLLYYLEVFSSFAIILKSRRGRSLL